MKTLAQLPKNIKMVSLLVVLMALIIGTTLSVRQALRSMDQTLASVYKDRLTPAVELVYLNENLFANRLLLGAHLSNHSTLSMTALQTQLQRNTQDSYQRIEVVRKTKLTDQEAQQLRLFKTNLSAYATIERNVLRLSETGTDPRAVSLFEQQGYRLFQENIRLIHGLTTIQHETGLEDVKNAHRQAASGSINATLLIGIAVIIGLSIQHLLTKRSSPKPLIDFVHLN